MSRDRTRGVRAGDVFCGCRREPFGPPAPKAKEPTQLGAAGDRCPSFSLGNFHLGATAVNREPLPIVSQLSAKRCLTIPFLTLVPTDRF